MKVSFTMLLTGNIIYPIDSLGSMYHFIYIKNKPLHNNTIKRLAYFIKN